MSTDRSLGIDLASTPFSRRGSYLALSRLTSGVYLRTVHGNVRARQLFQFIVGDDTQPESVTRPGLLTLRSGGAAVEVALAGPGRAVLRASGGTVVLDAQVESQYDVVLQERPDVWRFIASGANRNYRMTVDGDAHLDAGWDGLKDSSARLVLDAGTRPVMVTIDEFSVTPPAFEATDIDGIAAEADTEYEAWFALHGHDSTDATIRSASRAAAFVTWAAMVPAGGALLRESMLMSKNRMTNIWAWDHCFNAMALWRDPAAAADQLLTVFDHQDIEGGIPDYINDAGVEPNFVKPPIHGWSIGFLMDRGGLTDATVTELYDPLARWTDWWFRHRVYGDDGVPSYNHGNDSGWDNSTVFAAGVPLQSPDLLAFLALQMSTLARMADLQGLSDAADAWRRRARQTVDLLLERFWVSERFVARDTRTGRVIESDSLLTLIPLVLGAELPTDVFAACVDRLVRGGYLTAHGPATEPVDSRHYEADGYWRGPIWAPSTMLLIDGLRRGGRVELADDLADRFVATCTAGGMAENFDALTGAGLRDLSMTWTASVFLTLLAAPAARAEAVAS